MKRRLAALALLVPLFAGCSVATPSADPGKADPVSLREGVPGYPMGEIPPVPLFVMPDLSMLDSSMAGFSIKIRDEFPSVPGVTIRPARCDKDGTVQTDTGSLQFYGNGSSTYTDGSGKVINNYGDGSGDYKIGNVRVNVEGDGSGTYTNGIVSISSYGDGHGDYTDGRIRINLYGDGHGDYTDGTITINNYGDGHGDYTNGIVTINNYGNGAGDYTDGTITLNNYGDGTGDFTNTATGERLNISPKPIAPLVPLGTFPKMGTLKPMKSCGTRITIDDSVLFDFNKDTLRPGAKDTMAKLASVFTKLKIGQATISGHTDAIGSNEYNQDLSERRANTVRQALLNLNVTTSLTAVGYGETKPVAPNEIKGKDNPAGRQANRRVEIFIPNA